MPKFVFFEYLHFTWNSHFGVRNVKLIKIWPRGFNWLKKTKLEPKFEVSISKNKETGQQCSYQKIWKILLSKGILIFVSGQKNFLFTNLQVCRQGFSSICSHEKKTKMYFEILSPSIRIWFPQLLMI